MQVFDSTGALLRSFGTQGSADGQLNTPRALGVDNQGSVYVTDDSNASCTGIYDFLSGSCHQALVESLGLSGESDRHSNGNKRLGDNARRRL